PHSAASARVKLINPPLLVLYAIVPMPGGLPASPAMEAIFTILPARLGIIERLPTSCVRKNVAFRLRLMTLFQPSAGYSSAGAPHVAPALFTRMSTAPNRSSTFATVYGIVSSLERSPATARTSALY